MKILHTTDLHFNKGWFEWIMSQKDNFDIFCISGDLLENRKEETLREQIEWISRWINNFQKPLFICSGNHDIEEFGHEDWLNKIDTANYYADNSLKTIGNIKFGCFPFLGSDGYYEFGDCDVLITHVPPAKTKTSTDKNGSDWGDSDLTRAIINNIVTSRIILCGHMHHPIKTIDTIKNTTIYNTGVDKTQSKPNHHIITI